MPDPAPRSATVGRPVAIEDLVLPGTRLVPRADPDRRAPVTVRIVDVAPHGDLLRYRLEATAWEPGEHDLRAALVRADGGPTADLPPIVVVTESLLPAGAPRVAVPAPVAPPPLGGYGTALALLAACWLAGLALLLRAGRRRSAAAAAAAHVAPEDRLARLAETARGRPLDAGEKAEIERLVWEAWRRELAIGSAAPEKFLAALRADARAAAALDSLEAWLHAPPGETREAVEVDAFVAALLPPPPSVRVGGADR